MTETWRDLFPGHEKMGRVLYAFECRNCRRKIVVFQKGQRHEEPGCGVDPETQAPSLLDPIWYHWPKRRRR